ncbi:MAG: hypothetical protein CSA86_04370 [Arcobacter sp.]|nr:MAG: hypothetical protein CSA86_04370 [Arcobacter sp.]
MENEKFISEVNTLKKFFTLYCKDNHTKQKNYIKSIDYKNQTFEVELELCQECTDLINYAILRLQSCPHEIKPRCRKCPNPCYEKTQWKKMAKLMKYSGMRLGLLKIKNFFRLTKSET